MNKLLCRVSLFAVAAVGCCPNGVQRENKLIAPDIVAFVPYTEGQPVQFTNGVDTLHVQAKILAGFYNFDDCACCAFQYEQISARLESPDSNGVSISLDADAYEQNILTVRVDLQSLDQGAGYYRLRLRGDTVTCGEYGIVCYDSLAVAGEIYHEVYELQREYANQTPVFPRKVFCTREDGVVKIVLSDGRAYVLIP